MPRTQIGLASLLSECALWCTGLTTIVRTITTIIHLIIIVIVIIVITSMITLMMIMIISLLSYYYYFIHFLGRPADVCCQWRATDGAAPWTVDMQSSGACCNFLS